MPLEHCTSFEPSHREGKTPMAVITGQELIAAAQAAVPTMSNTDLNAKLTAGENVVVLDVREPDEWEAGHIPQGTHLARGRIEGRIEETIPDRNTTVVTH